MSGDFAVEMENINKSFYGVQVLKDAQIRVKPGEIHGLVGENGAGKTTLMNILGGIHQPDSGTIKLQGEPLVMANPIIARENHIGFVHQELCLADQLSITDNVFMGSEIKLNSVMQDKKAMFKRTQKALDALGLNLNPNTCVEDLTVAQKQMVEIAKAVCFDAEIIIFDEPTSSLTLKETEALFNLIRKMKKDNLAIIYISHRLEEIFEICDTVTVMRDARHVVTKPIKELNNDQIISYMVGREITQFYADEKLVGGDTILEVNNLSNHLFKNVSFQLKRGEILGFFGLVGAGRTETMRALFGIDKISEGQILLEGKDITSLPTLARIHNGLAMITEDRKRYGLDLYNSVAFNLTLMVAHKFIKNFHVDRKLEQEIIDEYANKLSIKMSGTDQLCINLSGGNQQKVVISKCLAAGSKVLIMDEPTRGIDVGAKSDIYHLMNQLAESGVSIIMVSSELPELLNICNRIAVMHEGTLVKVLNAQEEEITQEKVMYAAVGAA